jgi:glucosamine--fructose-6-phosphate aminotransferase (isomerizing)
MSTVPPYISDILSQPEALRSGLNQFPRHALDELATAVQRGRFNRMVLTGMGASHTGAYPAWLILARSGMPVNLIETSELLHYAPAQIDAGTLLWVISQSGYSAEILGLLDHFSGEHAPAAMLGITNNLSSPVGQRCSPALDICAGDENTVSTRTYMNTLAVTQLAALQLIGEEIDPAMDQFYEGIDQIAAYLSNWQEHVADLKQRVGFPKRTIVIGRGASLAAVTTGGLILKEAAKYNLEGMSAAMFRHGPLELADETLTLLIYEGAQATAKINHDLGLEVQRHGGHVFWLSSKEDSELPTIVLPAGSELVRPMLEILPLQMLSIGLAEFAGFEPGKFRHIGKITKTE